MSLVGKMLGQFQITDELGKGGMATVYKAYQASLQRYVAIKVLLPALAEDLDLVKRFLREARSAAALHHPNIIVIHDVGSEESIHYIVAEYLEGVTLSQLLEQEQAFPPERTVGIVYQVASALDYAHSRGFIHRDIKPSNIMVDPQQNDRVTLMDFGLVQVAGASKITRTGFIMGTPDYMSPEQARGDPIDYRTDIYSLGVTVYHMLTGQVPFVKPTPHAILLAHMMEEPPPMSTPGHPIVPEIEGVVCRAMAKNPADRYEWAGDMVSDLETAIINPAALTPPSSHPLAAQTTTVSAPAPETPPVGVSTYRPTPPDGVPGYRTTPPPGPAVARRTPSSGMPSYVSTPPAAAPAAPSRPRWIWPLLGGAGFLGLVSLLVVGLLVGLPLLSRLSFLGQPTPTATVRATTAVPDVSVERFEVYPLEIVQGASVTIDWQVSGVESISIRPNIVENAPPQGSREHRPFETTVYELVLPDGQSVKREVRVNAPPAAPTIEYFRVEPEEQVRGREVRLSWRVSGPATKIELSTNLVATREVRAEETLSLTADRTATFILTASNGDASSTRSVTLKVIEPPSPPTEAPTPTPTHTPAATPTALPPTATLAPPTATAVPPTATPVLLTATAAPTRSPAAATPAPSSGVLFSFEQWSAWRRGDQPSGELAQTQEQVKSGSFAAKLSYRFPESGDDFVVFVNVVRLNGAPNTISAWVYGDGSGHLVNAWIQDAQNQVWSIHLGRVGPEGWQQMTGTIDASRPWPSGPVSGPDNGAIDYPIRFYAIVLDRPGSGPTQGAIYLDDISVSQVEGSTAQPEATAAPPGGPAPGETGRIVFTVQVGEMYTLYSTDPSWDKMVKIGDTDWSHSTCADTNTTMTLDGIALNLRPFDRCPIAGTVDSCTAPNGQFKVNTNHTDSGYSVTLWRASDNKMLEAYYQGPLNIHPGLNWAPDSSYFLFTVDQTVYRADVGKAGYYLVIPFKEYAWPLQHTPDGAHVFYPKPVNGAIADIFIARPDGSGERNLTNAPIAMKMCPRWRN